MPFFLLNLKRPHPTLFLKSLSQRSEIQKPSSLRWLGSPGRAPWIRRECRDRRGARRARLGRQRHLRAGAGTALSSSAPLKRPLRSAAAQRAWGAFGGTAFVHARGIVQYSLKIELVTELHSVLHLLLICKSLVWISPAYLKALN